MKRFRPIMLTALFAGVVCADDGEDYFRFASGDPFAQMENLALASRGTVVWVRNAGEELSANTAVQDGVLGESPVLSVSGVPFEIVILLPKAERISGIRLFHGQVAYAGNASGEVGILHWKLMAEADGNWREALPGTQTNQRYAEAKAGGPFTFNESRRFPSVFTDKLRLIVTASSDTGRRMGSTNLLPAVRRSCYVREVEVFSTDHPRTARELPLNSILEGDYTIPVWQNARVATLYVRLRPELIRPVPIEISWTHRRTSNSPVPPRAVTLLPGKTNLLSVPIADWPAGEYRTVLRGKDGSEAIRWLRLERVALAPAPTEPIPVAGSTLLFIDEYHLQSQNGFTFVPQVAEQKALVEHPLNGDRINQRGQGFFLESNGALVATFYGMERSALNPEGSLKAMERKAYLARSLDGERWETREGAYIPPAGTLSHPTGEKPPPVLGTLTGRETFRFHDPKVDGPVPLSNVIMHFSGYRDTNFGPMRVASGTVVPLWRRDPSNIVFLTPKPLLGGATERRNRDEDPGEWNVINDNFGGHWLSADGKSLFFCMGRRVPRHPPFHIPFDNLPYHNRLMTVYSTTNGCDWSPSFVCPPEEGDPSGWQHYGLNSFPLEGGHLRMAYLYAYDAMAQQIHLDLAYTRNNLLWHRLRGSKPFAGNGPLGSWNYGFHFASGRHLVKDGRAYMLLNYCCNQPHFAYRYITQDPTRLAPADLQKIFLGVEIEKWTWWKDIGSWETFHEKLVTPACYTVGVLSIREDGWVAAVAGEQTASLTTCLLATGKGIALNARTLGDGEIRVELLDGKGRPMTGFSGADAARFKGDRVNANLSWKGGALGGEPLRLRITARKAELYGLRFGE